MSEMSSINSLNFTQFVFKNMNTHFIFLIIYQLKYSVLLNS